MVFLKDKILLGGKVSLWLCGFLFVFVAIANCNQLKLVSSTDNSEESLHVVALKKFDELVRKYSNGRIVTEIHYRGSIEFPAIRGEEVNVNMVMAGRGHAHEQVHITVVASGNVSQKVRVLNFLMLPYMFYDFRAAQRLFESDYMLHDINEIIAKRHNVRALGWLIGGFRHMTNSVKPVKRLEDIKGLNIRTPRNRLMKDTYKAFGATVKPLDWEDTFNALKDGKVDGQENPYNVIFYSKFWNANQKYVTNNGPFLWTGPILMNEDFYQSLPPDLKEAVKRAGMEAASYEWEWIKRNNQEFRQALSGKGMQIIDLEDKQKWIDATRKLWGEYYENIGNGNVDEGKAVVDKILDIIGK